MQAGDKIDLVGIPLAGASEAMVNNNSTLQVSSNGTVVANLRYNGAGFTIGSFQALADDGAGGVLVQTANTILDPTWFKTSGDFGTATNWTTGTVPGTADTALITAQNPSPYTVTVSTPQKMTTLISGSANATVLVQSTLNASTVYDSSGTFDVVSGGSLTAAVFQQTGSGGTLLLEPGSTMILRGGTPSAAANGNPGLDIENTGTINGAIYSAAAGVNKGGDSFVGSTGIGSLLVENGSTVTDTYAELGNFNLGSGSLTITGALTRWTDAGGDITLSPAYNGGMLVGGGGFSSTNGSLSSGGVGVLLVDQGATLTEANFAMIGYTGLSNGSATVSNGAHWNIGTGTNATPTLSTSGTSSIPTLTVGDFNQGALTIASAGTVTIGGAQSADIYRVAIGYATSGSSGSIGTGTLTVAGAGSKLDDSAGPMVIGHHGNGTVNVLAGGTVLVGAGGASSGFTFGATVGNRDASSGTGLGVGALTIDGASSLFSDSSSFLDGRDGVGLVVVRNSGRLAIGGTLYVGGSGATTGLGGGVLNVATGGRVTATALHLYANSTANAPAGDQVTVDSASALEVGTAGSPAVGFLTVDAGFTADGAGVISGSEKINGVVAADVAGGTLNLGGGSLTGSGSLSIVGTAVLNLLTPTAYTVPVVYSGVGGTLRLQAPSAQQGTIRGLVIGDTIDVPGAVYPTASGPTYDGSQLSFFGHVYDVGSVNGAFAAQPDSTGGTQLVVVACFRAGTRILTAAGERAVESLREGDLVATLQGGGLRPVRWVGRTRIDLDRHPQPEKAAPIRVQADAFGPGMPHRDLFLSGDHAVFTGDALIPVQLLVNGLTIARQPASGVVEYFHVELSAHSVLLAEGLPAESYLDTGNRGVFEGADVPVLHPDLSADLSARSWDQAACATLLLGGARVAAEHGRLLARAKRLGHRLTRDPAIRIEADGVALDVRTQPDGRVLAEVPEGTRALRLLSRRVVPQELEFASDDRRCLGVAVAGVRCAGIDLELDDALCAGGFHPREQDGDTAWRWTDGAATLRLPAGGALEIRLMPGWRSYVDHEAAAARTARRA